jgi:hypothetical protein
MAYTGPERREHERIEIQMKARLWLDEPYKDNQVQFEGFAITQNLAIGGTFIQANYLLPIGFPMNLEMQIDDREVLAARAEIVHRAEDEAGNRGMGVVFTDMDAENRERLLRFFVSDRIKQFYTERFVVEFPHLEQVLSLKDVALVINLWEDKEGRLTALRKAGANRTAGGGKARGGGGKDEGGSTKKGALVRPSPARAR